jgi:hypothetical protein
MPETRKYGSIIAEIQKEQEQPPAVVRTLLPPKPPAPPGKRRDPSYEQKGVYLKTESVAKANARLAARTDKTDFSDLIQALLDAWLFTPE